MLAPSPPARTASGGFKAPEGTIYVSQPFRSSRSKKLRATISFTPRISAFDTTNTSSGTNEFRGFFSLFWISMFLFTVQTYVGSLEKHGYVLSMAFATMFSKHAIALALSDGFLVAITALSVVFAKLLHKGWIKYYWTGLVIQHVFQTLVLTTAITWTFHSQWPWVQSGFLTLHTLVLVMKMHSYMAVNGYLQYVDVHSRAALRRLHAATSVHGGWDACISEAKARRDELNAASGSVDTSPSGTPGEDTTSDGTKYSTVDADVANVLRRRLAAAAAGGPPPPVLQRDLAPRAEGNHSGTALRHTLEDHPDPKVAALAKDYSELEVELTSSGPQFVRWPDTITYKNFAVYMLFPTLVYELEYPRTERIRPLYIFEKTVATFGTFALLYSLTESFIIPLTPTPHQSFFRSLLDLALPFMIAYLLLFYLIFECICNAFAELSFFADRQFYEDWFVWNSTSWDEFSRKWNKPVHTFLLRHVYASTMASYKLSKGSAMFLTFLLSAAVHELVMVVVTRKIRMYLFLLQLIQVPLIMLSRSPVLKRIPLLGNIVFWLGLYAGLPLLCVAYVAY